MLGWLKFLLVLYLMMMMMMTTGAHHAKFGKEIDYKAYISNKILF
jgi:hypothetical protein